MTIRASDCIHAGINSATNSIQWFNWPCPSVSMSTHVPTQSRYWAAAVPIGVQLTLRDNKKEDDKLKKIQKSKGAKGQDEEATPLGGKKRKGDDSDDNGCDDGPKPKKSKKSN